MDPLLPPLSAANAASDSLDSSPRSRAAVDALADDSLPAKLRLMCSYGGHIIPRPHDKSLCYVGGETRMVAMDRQSSLSDLSMRLSRSLLSGRPFTLKYQLPNEDLDSLISVSTDEDLDNMIDEYDRIASVSPLKPSRLRLFLFFNKPETVASMGTLLDDAKSETWFVDALNNSGILPRGLSDSATMDCLLNLGGGVSTDLEAQVKSVHDLHFMPDSPMIENSSSYGSSSSSPSTANLPPIRVRVADQDGVSGVTRPQEQRLVSIEEQFGQMTMDLPNLNEGFGLISAPMPPMPSSIVQGNLMNVAANQIPTASENVNRIVSSEEEKTDQGVPVSFRKPPLPLQPIQVQPMQQRATAAYNLPSPDSVASDSSIASASSLSRPMIFEDQFQAAMKEQRGPPSPTLKGNDLSPNPTSNAQMQQLQESGYVLSHQPDHPQQQQQQPQQYVHMTTHYFPHPPTNQVLHPSYYPMYATQPQQQQQQQQQYQINQQQPMYVMSVPHHNQPYNMSMQMQQNVNESSGLVLSRPPPSPSPGIVQSTYSTKAASQMQPEMSATIYSSYMSPQLIQVPSSQYPPQHMGMSQMNHMAPSQSIAAASSASGNYGLDYSLQGHDQAYYPPQYQTMTAAAAAALSDASKQQLPMDMGK